MNGGRVLRGAQATAERAAAAAAARAADTVASRAAVVGGVTAQAVAGDVVLRGAGLVARAFGSRTRPADPRLRSMVTGDGR
jgi:pantothenate kinase type III